MYTTMIAKVYDLEIYRSEYLRELDKRKDSLEFQSEEQLKKHVLDILVNRYLLLHEALSEGLQILPDELEQAMFDLLNQYQTELDFDKALEERHIMLEQVEELTRRKMIIDKYIRIHCTNCDEITPQRIHEIYEEHKEYFMTQEEVRCSHILVKTDCECSDALQKITDIRNRIQSAMDFKRESREISDCPSCVQYGDLGYFPRGKMVKEIDDAVFSMSIGEISQPVHSPFGYHILMVTDKKSSRLIPFEQIKDSLQDRLITLDKSMRLVDTVNELKERAAGQVVIYWDIL